MSITYLSHDEGIEKLARLLLDGKLVPIIGAGFTKDCISKNGKVPDGNQCVELMNDLINKQKPGTANKRDFNDVAKKFFNHVPRETQNQFFCDHFTGVSLKIYLKNFIELPWPYIYTINIDDAIETASGYKAVLPYQDIQVPTQSLKLVYKLHGDAAYEILGKKLSNGKEERIIFTDVQYIQSLTSDNNKTMRNAITSDYKQKNLVFIGCSLKKEPDLEFLYNSCKDDIVDTAIRCVIREGKLTDDDEENLESYGINTVISVNSYELFYRNFISTYSKLKAMEHEQEYVFKNPASQIIAEDDHKENIEYISCRDIFDSQKNCFYKSKFHIIRECISDIEKRLSVSNGVIIRGRRFSGKTFILSTLAEHFQAYTVLYFPSKLNIDEDILRNLLKKQTNTLFLFDSNSLANNAYQLIVNSKENLEDNKNKIVVATNSNDTYLLDALDIEAVPVSNVFYQHELDSISRACDKYGIMRRKKRESNLDYLKRLQDDQKIEIPFFDSLPTAFDREELVLLVLLCMEDKVYLSDVNALDISFKKVDQLVERMAGMLEKVPTTKKERGQHSSEKLVCNSKYCLLSIMKNLKVHEVEETITYIVSHFINDKKRKRLYINAVLFDTLNQLFGHAKGAGDLIFKVYSSLEPYLNQDMDYWLQRAKSIYRLYSNDLEKLKLAYQYAKKAASDGGDRITVKASLTISLICCLIAQRCNTPDEKFMYQKEAVQCSYTAIFSPYFENRQTNLKGELNRQRKDSYVALISDVCNEICSSTDDVEIDIMANRTLKKLRELSDGVQ